MQGQGPGQGLTSLRVATANRPRIIKNYDQQGWVLLWKFSSNLYSLIMQNLVAISYTTCAYVGPPFLLGGLVSLPL